MTIHPEDFFWPALLVNVFALIVFISALKFFKLVNPQADIREAGAQRSKNTHTFRGKAFKLTFLLLALVLVSAAGFGMVAFRLNQDFVDNYYDFERPAPKDHHEGPRPDVMPPPMDEPTDMDFPHPTPRDTEPHHGKKPLPPTPTEAPEEVAEPKDLPTEEAVEDAPLPEDLHHKGGHHDKQGGHKKGHHMMNLDEQSPMETERKMMHRAAKRILGAGLLMCLITLVVQVFFIKGSAVYARLQEKNEGQPQPIAVQAPQVQPVNRQASDMV